MLRPNVEAEFHMPNSSHSTLAPPEPAPLTVLFAPAHILIDELTGGSEYHWPYKLFQRLALDHGVRAIALTVQSHVEHHLPGVTFVSVDPTGALPSSNLERLRFHLRVYAMARQILAGGQKVDVIHHMLPFGFRATFNLLALLHRRADPPVVIGPLQSPLSFQSDDETHVAMRNFAASPTPARQRRRSRPPLSTLAATPALSALSAQTLRRSAALVAISQQAARLYRPFAPCHDLTVIPAGVDTAEFTPRSPESHGHVALEANSRPVQVMACGYLVRRKAFDVLIKAIAELTRSDIPVHLRLVGEGPARAELESLVRHLGIERHVTFAGLVPHHAIMYEYRRADVFCSTSLSESFSIVGLEALACGLPIVATPTGFFRELPPSRQVGALVRFGAVDELATALATLILTPSLRETMGHHARALAVQEYDWGVIARRYMAIYNRLTAPTV